MTVFLKIRQGDRFRDVAVIPPVKPLTVGRATQNDAAFPEDSLMSSRHLTIELQGQACIIRDLGSTNGTTLNGTPVESATVGPGDVFKCGATEFFVEWAYPTQVDPLSARFSGRSAEERRVARPSSASSPSGVAPLVGGASPPASKVSQNPDIAATQGYCAATAEEIVKRFRLRQRIPLTPEDRESPQQFLDRLAANPDGAAELEFLSYALPKRCAIWWLVQCVRTLPDLNEEDMTVIGLVETWIRDPGDQNRRQAMAAIQDADLGRAANWTAMSAYYADGSTAPPNSPHVAAKDDIAGKSVLAGVTLAALVGPPDKVRARRKRFSLTGQQIARGEIPWTDQGAVASAPGALRR